MAVGILDQVRSFLTAPKLDEALGALAHNPPTPPIRTSWVWDSHITESAGGGGKGKLPQSVSLSWDENEARGIESSMRSWQGLTPRERKEILLAIYLANPTVSACVDAIANRICSGGFTVEKIDEEAKDNQEHYDQLMEFCLRINDDWDFLQYARASIKDQLIFGETYSEIIWKARLPFQLYKVDCISMHYRINRTGRILRFEQQLTSTSEVNQLDPENIIRWWTPHPHASIDPFSPIEKVQDPVNLDKKMVNWVTTFFQKGAKFPYWVEFPGGQDEAQRFIEWFRQNYTGEKNAHIPPVAYDGAKLHEFQGGSFDIDFPGGRDRNQTQVLSAYLVPPAAVSIIESGNIGGGTGEDQDKSLRYNACDPVKGDWLEKLNYRVTKRGFKIGDYRIGLRYADYRSDESLAKVADTRIRNGSRTINETRTEEGRRPYQDGGDVGIVVASKDVFPVPRITDMEDEQKQSAQLDIEAKQVANEKAKNPPEPTMLPGQTNQPSKPAQGNVSKKGNTASQKQQKESHTSRWSVFQEAVEFDDRYQALGIPYPDSKTTCPGECEGTGYVPVRKDDLEEPWYTLWLQAEQENPNEPGDNWHFVKCPLCHGTGKKQKEESINAQTTQPPAHQQSPARLTLLSPPSDAQEGTTEAGEVRGATTEDSNNHLHANGRGIQRNEYIPPSSITEAGKDHFTGMMLAFMLDPETAKKLAIPDGESVDNLHITLAYLGDTEEEPEDDLLRPHTSPFKIRDAIAMIASKAKPLTGNVGGVGRFFPAETEETPVIALVDVPGLVEFRNKLAEIVEAAGYFVANNHGYTPHITLSYIDASAPMPIDSAPSLPLTLDTVMLCVGDERIPFKLGGEPQQQQESANEQSDRDKLAYALAAIFLAMQTRGAEQLGAVGALAAYQFSSDEKNRMVDILADAYMAARAAAYIDAFSAIGSDLTWVTTASDIQAARQWATEQVASITSTFEEMFHGADPEDAKQWIEDYSSWKTQQIANVTIGTGSNIGTRSAVDDMLEALTSDEIDTSLIPGGLSAESIRLRVVPDSSSSDFCSEYAGKTFSLDEEGDIPVWPAHPGCVHSIEVYVVVGGTDEPEA